MRVEEPLLQADHLDLWELLADLRDYACSTHTAFFPVVTDSPYDEPLPESLDKRIVYNATECFAIFDSLLREDVEILEDLLSEMLPEVDLSPNFKLPHRKSVEAKTEGRSSLTCVAKPRNPHTGPCLHSSEQGGGTRRAQSRKSRRSIGKKLMKMPMVSKGHRGEKL